MNIRTAIEDDVEQVVSLINELILELGGAELEFERAVSSCRRLLADPMSGLVLVAQGRGATVGVCTISFQEAIRTLGRYAIIQEMYVIPQHRNRSLGAKIVERAVVEARANGCSVIELGTPPEGQRQEKFYHKLGFKPVGLRLRRVLDS